MKRRTRASRYVSSGALLAALKERGSFAYVAVAGTMDSGEKAEADNEESRCLEDNHYGTIDTLFLDRGWKKGI